MKYVLQRNVRQLSNPASRNRIIDGDSDTLPEFFRIKDNEIAQPFLEYSVCKNQPSSPE